MDPTLLPSWRPGPTRDALVAFLDRAGEIPPADRIAVFDNDGTLWCEKPNYVQLDFFVHELRAAVERRPELGEVAAYRAVLAGDRALIGEIGLVEVALALVDLFTGMTPEEFEARVRGFFETARHPDRSVAYDRLTYLPMLELIAALRDAGFGVRIVTGGGTEFVRAISRAVYDVAPEHVVGSLVGYDVVRDDGPARLVRTNQVHGDPNEGDAKLVNMRMALGTRATFAAGNSAGDAAMLDDALVGDGPRLALLVDHDDAEREYAYESVAGSFETSEPITDVARRSGWTVASIRDDWSHVFTD